MVNSGKPRADQTNAPGVVRASWDITGKNFKSNSYCPTTLFFVVGPLQIQRAQASIVFLLCPNRAGPNWVCFAKVHEAQLEQRRSRAEYNFCGVLDASNLALPFSLFWLFGSLALAQSDAGATAIFVDESPHSVT
jgi:hypothetical protein